MTAMTVTPEIIRVVFLRSRDMSLRFCVGLSWAISSALEGICLRWCFAAVCTLSRCRSLGVGLLSCIKFSRISLIASVAVVGLSIWLELGLEIDKQH